MGNCLKTQLKENVNNDNLPIYGKILIKAKTAVNPENNYLDADIRYISDATTMEIETDGNYISENSDLSNRTNKVQITSGYKRLYFVNGDYDIYISSKYGRFRTLDFHSTIFNINLSEFKYLNILSTLSCYSNIQGAISELNGIPGLNAITLYSDDVTGNIQDLYNCIGLVDISIQSDKVGGALETLAEKMVVDGHRVRGTMRVSSNGVITLNGSVMSGRPWVKFGSDLPSGAIYEGNGFAIYTTNPDS